jgi:hypothetical protein
MHVFRITLALFALLPLVTGLADVLLGVTGQVTLGVQVPASDLADPVLDSQFRFLASCWFGLGLLLCLCAWRPRRYPNLLRGTLFVIFLGGIGRGLAVVQTGWPAGTTGLVFVVLALLIELVGMPLLLWWHWRITARERILGRAMKSGETTRQAQPGYFMRDRE